MSRNLKLIWDFRGESATQTATHHEIHLKEFLITEQKKTIPSGFETLSEMHAIAYIIVPEQEMLFYRDALKPHRGEVAP